MNPAVGSARADGLGPVPDGAFVFNVVWTGSVFSYLCPFVVSQMHYCGARYRFVSNGCPSDQIELMEEFRRQQSDRVVEVLVTSDTMETHGAALDAVRAACDDGPFFCTVDPDILALGPFLAPFAEALVDCAAITSGRGVWRDDDVIPLGHPGVSGEYFYAPDGFLFGSPHFAMYHRRPLEDTARRWGLSLGEAGAGLSRRARDRLGRSGHNYWMYDTGKLLNIFLQEDGNVVRHEEHANLMHIGGLSHYLAPTGYTRRTGEEPEPNWGEWRGMTKRFEVARFTAAVLRARTEGDEPPTIPPGLEPAMHAKLEKVRSAVIDTVDGFGTSAHTTLAVDSPTGADSGR